MNLSRLLFTSLFPLLAVGCLDQPFATNVDLPLQVLAIHPSDGAEGVARDAAVQVVFNLDVIEASVTAPEAIVIEDVSDPENPVAVEGARAYVAGGEAPPTFTFTPSSLLPYSRAIRVTVTTAVQRAASDDVPEGALLKPVVATFATADPPVLQVISVSPSAGATGVSPDTSISITFSEPVDCASLEGGLTIVEDLDDHPHVGGGTRDVTGVLSCPTPPAADIAAADISCADGACTSVFTPDAPFALSSVVSVSLKGGPVDAAPVQSFRATLEGGQLPQTYDFSFTIEDPAPLVLVSTVPGNGADNVAADTTLTLTFSEPVDCTSIQAAIDDGSLFAVETLDDAITGAAQSLTLDSCEGNVAVLSFAPGFSLSSTVDVTLPETLESAIATSRGGNLVGGALLSFSIIDPPPLRVVSTTPGAGASGVATTTNVFVTFSEDVDCATVTPGAVLVRETYDTVTATQLGVANVEHAVTVVSCSANAVELDIGADLQLSSNIEVVLSGTIASARATSQGGALEDGAGYGWSFNTANPPSLLVVFTSPGDENTLVPVDEPIVVSFSEALDLTSVSDTSFVMEQLTDDRITVVGTALSAGCGTAADGASLGTPCTYAATDGDMTVAFTPPTELEYDTWYRFRLTTDIRSARYSSAGGTLSQELVYEFKTIVSPPVEVVSLVPAVDTIGAQPTFQVTLNQEIFAPDTDGADADLWLAPVSQAGDAPDIANAVALDCAGCIDAGSTYSLTPTAPLSQGAFYVFVVAGDLDGVRGTSGGAIMLADYTRTYLVGGDALLAVTDPADGAVDVSVASPVCATFFEDMDPATVDDTTFVVMAESDLGVNVPVVLDQFVFDGVDPLTGEPDATFTSNRVCFVPAPAIYPCREVEELLPANTTVFVTLDETLASTSGTELGADSSWSFSTGGLPSVLGVGFDSLAALGFTGALDDEQGVPVTASLWVLLSHAVDDATLGQVVLTRLDDQSAVAATVTSEDGGTLVRIQPTDQLAFLDDLAEGYAYGVMGGALGLLFEDGRYLGEHGMWSFETSTAPQAALSPPPGEPGFEAMIAPVTFSRAMHLPSINTATFTAHNDTLAAPLTSVVGTSIDDDDSATLMPVPTWPEGNQVTVTASTGIMDARGNPLAADVTVTYASIQSAPALAARTPAALVAANLSVADGAAVTGDQRFVITFPAPGAQLQNRMLPPTFSAGSLKVSPLDAACDGRTLQTVNDFTVGAAGLPDQVTFWADQPLLASCSYEVRLVQKDFANIYTASATGQGGGAPADVVIDVVGETTAPTLEAAAPADAATDVVSSVVLTYDFSEAMDPASFGAGSITVTGNSVTVDGVIDVEGDVVTFTPNAPLTGGVVYTAVVENTVTDLAGNPFAGDTRAFTVENTAPSVVSITLLGDGTIEVVFSEPMAPATLTPDTVNSTGTVRVSDPSGAETVTVYGCVDLDATGTVAIFEPIEPLTAAVTYDVEVTSGATDLGGTALDTTNATGTVTP